MTTPTEAPAAQAGQRFATYPSDVSEMVGSVVGPNTMGEFLTAVSAEYDAETNKTHVGFNYGVPA